MSDRNYTLVNAGPTEVVDAKTKKPKLNTYDIQARAVNPADYPQYSTKTVSTAKGPKEVVILTIPATKLQDPGYKTLEGFLEDAKAFEADGNAKLLGALNAVLANGARAQRTKIGNDAKLIPEDPSELFVNVPELSIKAFFTGMERAASAKAQLDNVKSALTQVDMSDPEAVKRALAAAMAAIGM